MVTMLTSANAMSYEQAREQALFLTDKMAYELNLSEAQYEAAYEINLDYLMGVNTYNDVYADIWTRRNLDLSYILLDWQYRMFCDAAYFYRPLWWEAGHWHFGIYARYPHRDYFYFGRPHFYVTYRGGHAWHINGGRSWYHTNFRHPASGHVSGMRDGWNRGNYRGGYVGTTNHNPNRNSSVGGSHNSNVRDRNNSSVRDRNNSNYGGREQNAGIRGNVGTDRGVRQGSNAAERGNGTVERTHGAGVSRDVNRESGRESSTRTTVNRGSIFGGSSSAPARTTGTTDRSNVSSPSRSMSSGSSAPVRSMGGSSSSPSRSSMGGGSSRGSMGGASHGGASHGGGSRGGGFGGRR